MKTKSKIKETVIGKIIYGFLLFMPLLAISVTCAYAIFNKNAYQSYSDNLGLTLTQQNDNTFIVNNTYQFKYKTGNSITQYSPIISYSEINIDWSDYSNYTNEQVDAFRFYPETTGQASYIQLFYNGSLVGTTRSVWGTKLVELTIVYSSILSPQNAQPNYNLYNYTYNKQTLDNVFYYSINKVQESPLFNWAKQTSLYTVLNETCETLGIKTTFIPLLLTYWLLISLMYLLYDIALLVVHMAHNKIHEIEGSL